MPAMVNDSPLGITCIYSDGSTSISSLSPKPVANPALARQLLVALADLVHPHGRLDSARTIEVYLTAIRDLLTRLEAAGFRGDASKLTRGRMAEVWMATTNRKEALTRILLTRLDDLEGLLRPDVRALADGRLYNPNTRQLRRTLPPYSEAEWERLAGVCRSIVKESFAAYEHARDQAGRGADPQTAGWCEENVQWMLLDQGPEQAAEVLSLRFRRTNGTRYGIPLELYPGCAPDATGPLYPPWEVVRAYQLLFGVHTGLVPDGLGDLGLDGIDWAGDATVLLDYVKGRSGPESLVLSAKASRLLRQWVEHSSPARAHAPEHMRNDLWLRYSLRGRDKWQSGPISTPTNRWVRKHGLVDDSGAPLNVHSHRIRTTFESLRDRSGWRGSSRATIDPNHSPQVEGDHYLQVSTPAQKAAVDSIIEEAQHDMLRRAQTPVILGTDDAAELVARYPQTVAKLDLNDQVVAELLSGERDVFTAACADQLSGLHGPKGKPCPARPWVCLLCPLVMFAPRHLPNLMRLKAFFARQWKQMPAQQFMAVFGPYASRLDHLLTEDYFNADDLAKAAADVSDTDHDLPLRAEEMTA
ncbi:hypothetical protein ABCR94_02130 [Streptomyces sp. 21So2-11]|uniref:hypothetical protein n=1 Tax=Streptomyces sp. 21So2-11 TaxID=3144408 RepID=UPI00321A573B